MRSNRNIIIVISVVLTLVVMGVVMAYLFLKTDVFKSKQELFEKYFSQNAEAFEKITDLTTVENLKKLKDENKYEVNTNIKVIHSEGGEISNPLNNLGVKLDIQKNDEVKYAYIHGQVLYEDEEYIEAELIKEEEVYGVRFTDAVNQFVSVKNDENLESIANIIGIDMLDLQEIMNIIDGNWSSDDIQQMYRVKDKYVNIVTDTFLAGTFKKQKNAIITYNGASVNTNAYSVSLSNEQIKDMLIKILSNAKNENEILDKLYMAIDKEQYKKQIDDKVNWINEKLDLANIKITVYEQNEQTIRTVLEMGAYKITLENIEQNGELKTKINYLNNNDSIQTDIEMSKKNLDSEENFEIAINVIEGEENYTINLLNQMKKMDNQIDMDLQISHKQDIITKKLVLENEISIGTDFEKIQSLDSSNNIVLNDVKEQRRKDIIALLKNIVPQTMNERIELLNRKFGLKSDESSELEYTEQGETISQIEINKFNSKFEFYTGDEVSAENVNKLLDIVKNHLTSYEKIEKSQQEETGETEVQNPKVNLKLNIKKDTSNEEIVNEILGQINKDQKYKVVIFYKETNGLVDYIMITEI